MAADEIQEYRKIRIIYEDNHLLVAVKPQNMLSQADNTGDDDILTLLKEYLKKKYNKPGNVYLGLVHRLDRPVGGVMIFARTSKAASRLSEQVRIRDFDKTYLAIARGRFKSRSGMLEHFLVKDEKTNIVSVAASEGNGAKKALLDYEVIGEKDELSLVRIKLHTGRSHQIRVQFSASGHPLLGDRKYGNESGNGNGRQPEHIALWSAEIACRHPVTKEEMIFSCNPPEEFPWNMFEIV